MPPAASFFEKKLGKKLSTIKGLGSIRSHFISLNGYTMYSYESFEGLGELSQKFPKRIPLASPASPASPINRNLTQKTAGFPAVFLLFSSLSADDCDIDRLDSRDLIDRCVDLRQLCGCQILRTLYNNTCSFAVDNRNALLKALGAS